MKKEPAIRVESLMHRDNPVLLGAIPGIPPDDDSFYRCTYRSGAVWNQLEGAGVPEVKGVWSHETGGSRLWLNVSIKTMYPGHSKQAGLIASQCHAGAYANRFVVVVDDDIDPSDMNKVMWAMCTRFEPREGLEILRGCWSTVLDPMCYSETDPRNARVVIDACRPFGRRDTFPRVVRNSKELDQHLIGEVQGHPAALMSDKVDITLTINGRAHAISVEPRKTLVDAIRDDCGQTGTHIGCEHGVCGTCTVILDGEAIRVVPDVRGAGGRPETPHRRGARQWRDAASAAAGVHRSPRPAMRLLHAGLPDAGGECAGAQSGHRRRRTARRAVVQSLPLHRLPEHHQGGARRPRHDARREDDMNDSGNRHDYPLAAAVV